MIRCSTDSAHASFHELADLVFLCLHRFEKRLYWTGVWHVDHPVHRTFPILQWPNVISLLLLEHMPPTTPPLQHHIHCCSFWSYPAGLEGGGEKKGEEGHCNEVWIFKLTPNSLNTLDFALKKQSIRVFGKTHTPVSQLYSPIPVICACRWQWENKGVELRIVCLNVWYSFVYVCVWGQTKWRCAMFICPVSVSELTTVIVRRSHQHPFFFFVFIS